MLEIINPEFDVVIGDKTFVSKALSLNSLLKLSRQLKQRDYLKNAEMISATLPKEQRGKFMLDVLNEMGKPSANTEELAFADSLFSSVYGITEIIKYAILKYNKIDDKELDNLIEDNFNSDYFEYLSGIAYKILGVKVEEDDVKVESEEDSKKKSEDITTK